MSGGLVFIISKWRVLGEGAIITYSNVLGLTWAAQARLKLTTSRMLSESAAATYDLIFGLFCTVTQFNLIGVQQNFAKSFKTSLSRIFLVLKEILQIVDQLKKKYSPSKFIIEEL
jgi:hypothetical protein